MNLPVGTRDWVRNLKRHWREKGKSRVASKPDFSFGLPDTDTPGMSLRCVRTEPAKPAQENAT